MNKNFALKLQVNCWKADVVTFTGHLSVTIERLTRYKQKVVLTAMLEDKSKIGINMVATNNMKYRSKCHKTSLLNEFPLNVRV